MNDNEVQKSQLELNCEKWGAWQYNVRDHFKPLTVEQINDELDKTKLPCAVLMQHIEGDFNFGNIVRTSNNFNIANIYYYGKKRWDRRSSCGTHHYSNLSYLSSLEEVAKLKEKYSFVAMENNIGKSVLIKDFKYPTMPLFVFGEENSGIFPEVLEMCEHFVEIPSRGSVRSLNVGSAASIVLYDFWTKFTL